MLKRLANRLPAYAELHELMDENESCQLTAPQVVRQFCLARDLEVLDLGCGEGASLAWFETLDGRVRWRGVDITESPEVMARKNHDPRMLTFDGIHLPFGDAVFDLVYSQQVLEHVRRPHELLREVKRVLKPGGLFIGSVAYLEPYHSYSVFNFTPYGLKVVLESADLLPIQFRHSSDVFYKILRQCLGGLALFSSFSRISLLYALIDLLGWVSAAETRDVNLLKIQYSGAFSFVAKRP